MIDAHVHLGPFITDYFYGLESTIKQIEKIYYNFDGILLIPSDKIDNIGTFKAHKKTKLNTKFAAWIHPDNYNEVKDMEFDALKVHPAYSRIPISDELYRPTIELAEDREVPITCHSGEIEETSYHHIIDAAKEFKNVTFIVGHAGGKKYQSSWSAPIDIEPYSNLYIDTAMRFKFHWIEHCQKIIGSERMMYGSDYPLVNPLVGIQAITTAKVNFDQITDKTARRIFGW